MFVFFKKGFVWEGKGLPSLVSPLLFFVYACFLSGTYFMAATCVKSQISKVNLDFATYVAAAEYKKNETVR